MILAGDIGGTSARLAYFQEKNNRLVPVVEEVKHGRDYSSLQAALVEYTSKYKDTPVCTCLGIAGPVRDRRVDAANLPWIIDADALEREAGIGRGHTST